MSFVSSLLSYLPVLLVIAVVLSTVIKVKKKGYDSVGVPKAMNMTSGYICSRFVKYEDIKDQQLKKVSLLGVAHNTTISAEVPILLQGIPYRIEQLRGEHGYDIDAPCPQLSPETKGAIDIVITDAAFDALTSSANVVRQHNLRSGFSTNTYSFKQEVLLTQTTTPASTGASPLSA